MKIFRGSRNLGNLVNKTNETAMSQLPFQEGKFYHVFNRTNNKELLFKEEENYRFFLQQFIKYIAPIAHVYAYCLLANHFHFVIQLKEEKTLKTFFQDKLSKGLKPLDENEGALKKLLGSENLGTLISQQFSNFFNSYAKAINKRYNRQGSLFSSNFKRKEINTEEYLRQVIVYVHLNPLIHGIKDDFKNYSHSSYKSVLSEKTTSLKRKEVIELFDDLENLKYVHENKKMNEELLAQIIAEDD